MTCYSIIAVTLTQLRTMLTADIKMTATSTSFFIMATFSNDVITKATLWMIRLCRRLLRGSGQPRSAWSNCEGKYYGATILKECVTIKHCNNWWTVSRRTAPWLGQSPVNKCLKHKCQVSFPLCRHWILAYLAPQWNTLYPCNPNTHT